MRVQYHNPEKPDMIDGEWRSPKCDAKSRLVVVVEPGESVTIQESSLGGWTDHNPITVPTEPGAAQQLPSVVCSEIKLIADSANTQPIYVGGANVSSTKSQDLTAREVELVKRVANANQFYVVAAATHTGQKLRIQTR